VSHRLEIRLQALADIAESAEWYEDREPGLGERFKRDIVAAINALPPKALFYRIRNRRLGARWCYPNNFPHRIVYRVSDQTITIVAVIHASRRDHLWKKRLS